MLIGTVEVLEDAEYKEMIWEDGDTGKNSFRSYWNGIMMTLRILKDIVSKEPLVFERDHSEVSSIKQANPHNP